MAGKRWTPEEIAFIKANGIKMSCAELAQKMPGRTPRAIEHLFNKLGLFSERLKVKPGDKFGTLELIETYTRENYGQNITMARCRCKHGNIVENKLTVLRKGTVKSCLCANFEKFEERKAIVKVVYSDATDEFVDLLSKKLLSIHSGMKNRCYNTKQLGYETYGGKGIKVCDEWHTFMNFFKWAINNGYKVGLSLDRKDNLGNYEPGNCKWITPQEQCRNKTNNVNVTAFGETKTLQEWAQDKRCVVSYLTLRYRISVNWNSEEAIIKPSQTNYDNLKNKNEVDILYNRWKSMNHRCYNPKNLRYSKYGAKGITVCNEWKGFPEGFNNFYNWCLKNSFSKELTIDRKNNNEGYAPENCRLITNDEQSRNKGNNVWIEAFGERKTIMNWLKDPRCNNICHATLRRRIKIGWKPEDAISLPSLRG